MTTLVDKLIKPIDVVRSKLHALIGDRPYTVSLIKVSWDGGDRGVGNKTEIQRVLLDPPPMLSVDMNYNMELGGIEEEGIIYASEISMTLTEDTLTGLPLAVYEDFYWEIVYQSGGTCRYTVATQPIRVVTGSEVSPINSKVAGSFGYRVTLKRLSDAA